MKNLVEIELTNYCNARCIMCPNRLIKRKTGFITERTFKAIIKKSLNYGIEWVRLCGMGEPLLHKEFSKFINYLRMQTHLKIELITNGSLLTDKIIGELVQNRVDRISISFPSLVKRNYETIIRGLFYEDVLEKTLTLMDRARGVPGMNIAITAIVTKFNHQDIAQLQSFFKQRGLQDIVAHLPHNRGGYLENFYGIIGKQYYLKHRSKRTTACPAPSAAFYFTWEGAALLCCCDLEDNFKLGNLKTDLQVIDKLQLGVNLMRPALCRGCSFNASKLLA